MVGHMRELKHSTYDKFRGNETIIKKRQKKYIKYFDSCRNVLDVGCGRGEFLELLNEENISATGIDANEDMVKICREKGLDVFHINIYSFLKDKVEFYDGVFCSHIIEHLDPQDAVELLDLCQLTLKPHGMLIIITPNPQNLQVIANTFWLDLTHKRPYPLQLLEYLLTEREFEIIASGEDEDTVAEGWKQRILYKIDRRLTGGMFSSGKDIFVVAKAKKQKYEERQGVR